MAPVEAGWVRAAKLSELEEDEGFRVRLPGGKKDSVALFLHKGELFALEDSCCHAGKSIHGGDIEELADCVVDASGTRGLGGLCVQCPRHQRKFGGGLYFNLETGEARTPTYTSKFGKMSKHRVRVHDVKVHEGVVYVSERPRHRSRRSREIVISDGSGDEAPSTTFGTPKVPNIGRPDGGTDAIDPAADQETPRGVLPADGNRDRSRRGWNGQVRGDRDGHARAREAEQGVLTRWCTRLTGRRGSRAEEPSVAAADAEAKRPRTGSEDPRLQLTLERLVPVARDTFIFEFLQPAGTVLPPAPTSPIWHVTLTAQIRGEEVDRDYTPVSTWDEWHRGKRLRLLIKVYEDGKMTQHLAKLPMGSAVCVSPPEVTLSVPSLLPPRTPAAGSAAPPQHVVLLAAGTGVVPMLQVATAALDLKEVRTISLLYGCRSPEDLICGDAFRLLAERSAPVERLQVLLAFASSPHTEELASRAAAAASSGRPLATGTEVDRWPRAAVVARRLDGVALGRQLAGLPRGPALRVVVSGPEGFFDTMVKAFPAKLREFASFVDLDKED